MLNILLRLCLIGPLLLATSCGDPNNPSTDAPCPMSNLTDQNFIDEELEPPRILVFSKTSGYRHSSITSGLVMLQDIADRQGWGIDFSENGSDFTESNLNRYNSVVWLSTTGDVLDEQQQAAFQHYVENGGGYLGIHAAADTEYDWPWYQNLVGAHFASHPEVQSASITVENPHHSSTQHLPQSWNHTDEWYFFDRNPRMTVDILLTVDETTYDPGTDKMGDHPIAWKHQVGKGRAFYTALGHTAESYAETLFIEHIEGALAWVSQTPYKTPLWKGPQPTASDFTTSIMASGINEPVAMTIANDGQIFVIGRQGEFYTLDNGKLTVKSTFKVNAAHEGGLIGIALDPNFDRNRFMYFHYTHPSIDQLVVSRIPLKPDNSLDFDAEVVLLTYPVQLAECCHAAGDLEFDDAGNLYIATGDNTNPFESNGYAPIDEREGRRFFDAQRTSANTNDLRGKVLRIFPKADGSYGIPAGNLFSADNEHRPEIYSMGHRNPYKISIDPLTNTLYVGDIGPDAGGANAQLGPGGYDEVNKIDQAGNYGWPYFAGNNEAYNALDFETQVSGAKFNADDVKNVSPNNTGAKNLPNAQPAWIKLSHRATMISDIYRWDHSVSDPYKLPSYFDGHLLIWNFNDDRMYDVDSQGTSPNVNEWLNTSLLNGIIDAKISPANNRLYIIAYGGNCCDTPAFAGALAEVRYIGKGDIGQPTTPNNGNFKQGDIVSLRSATNKWSTSASGEITLAPATGADSQLFEVRNAGDQSVALRSVQTDLYVTAPADGTRLNAKSSTITAEQQFQLIEDAEGDFRLRSLASCQFVSTGNNNQLFANGSDDSTAEMFMISHSSACTPEGGFGITCRPESEAFLNLPQTLAADLSNMPALLSQTGAFVDVEQLVPSDKLIPYNLITPLWSDRAQKKRWVAVPSSKKIGWQEKGQWQWPIGTVLIKHFELPVDETDPSKIRRLETRFIVRKENGGVYGATYKWRRDNSDADLLTDVLEEDITITAPEGPWTQTWTYPSPEDCITCHNEDTGGVLGPKTASLNTISLYPSGHTDNQLRTWNHLNLFEPALDTNSLASLPAHAALDDATASLELRIASYWDINCGNCHGPQGIAADWDARFETPLAQRGVIWGDLVAEKRDYLVDYGLPMPYVIEPGNPDNSILYIRDNSENLEDRMPPLGTHLRHPEYIQLLKEWILSLPQ